MLRTVLAEPVILSADERYLMGHYLAYLLIGSRRRGLLLRRPLDRRNADRARFLLAMTYALAAGPTEEAVQEAASLLDQQIEVRPALSPVVVAKYLSWRDTPQRRRLFRQTRKALKVAGKHAQKHMTDAKGQLNPGLVPQTLDDLRKIAPARNVVDDVLVERWNRLAEVWRDHPDFRAAALRYASREAHRDPASQALWPEVVYPLIELARWQRRYLLVAGRDPLGLPGRQALPSGRRGADARPPAHPRCPRPGRRLDRRLGQSPGQEAPSRRAGRRPARSRRRG
jgi:eukaryotic-like serine/threonine-protein kinase